jgi:FlaA1/EpsC-like NDP-sugar epimerase
MESFVASLIKLRNRHFLLADLALFLVMPAVALAIRLDGWEALDRHGRSLLVATILFLAVKLLIYYSGGIYSRFWRYASIDELGHITLLGVLALGVQTALLLGVFQPLGWVAGEFPRSVPVIDGLLTLAATGALRFSVPFSERLLQRRTGRRQGGDRVLVVGAGSAGVMIVQEMRRNPHLGMQPVAFVDDAPDKQGVQIRGVPVLGRCRDIAKVVRATNAQRVVIAMPTAPGPVIREIFTICEQAGVHAKTIPGMYELLGGTLSVKHLRDVEIEDLLRRDPIQTDVAAVGELIRGKRVLITGGGGSIGRELCRQVLRFEPAALIILGHGENSVFEIQCELLRLAALNRPAAGENGARPPVSAIHAVIADIRFPDRMQAVFAEYRPEVVFHSAAHKHVPLMEQNPAEAVTNNILGTHNVLDAALAADVGRFVLISTDKAVNPTSVMGASKRVAELLVHQAAQRSGKPYVAVRFGNVLGSRGSVVLTFKQQIAAGGPVTVTHPQVTRYFMTIPEAVQLVLQAATLGRGGEVFMLDMGDPIKIVDLARDLIELSGLKLDQDIAITFVGLRPGEKLFEELFIPGEEYALTAHEKIYTVGNASSFIPPDLDRVIGWLAAEAQRNGREAILAGLHELVPEFRPAGEAPAVPVPRMPVGARPAPPLRPVPLPPAYLGTSESRRA